MPKLRYSWPTLSQRLKRPEIGSLPDSWADSSDLLSFPGFDATVNRSAFQPILEWLTVAVCDSLGCAGPDYSRTALDGWTDDWCESA
jgi:hypothetical protein